MPQAGSSGREMGEEWNRRNVLLLEQKEIIEEPLLQDMAGILTVPVEGIKFLMKKAAINVVGNSYHVISTSIVNYHRTFNSIDKIVAPYEKLVANKKKD